MDTDSERAIVHLTRDILSGALPPSGKLKVRHLTGRYAIGPTPLREALSKLAATGLVEQEGQRGFRVPAVTREHLLDITHTRQIVEPEAFLLAMQHGRRDWEDHLSTAMFMLRRVAERQDATEAWLDEYEERHHAFHKALIAACPYPTLRGYCDELYAQKTRYRRFLRSLGTPLEGVVDRHEELARLAIERDPIPGMAAIRAHIGSTADYLLDILDGGRPP